MHDPSAQAQTIVDPRMPRSAAETTLIRVGNDDYAKTNKSYGLTTLRTPHVKVTGTELRFQ